MKILRILIIILMLSNTVCEVRAQVHQRAPMLRTRILQVKLAEIQKTLQLDQSTLERFKPIYASFDKEMAGVNFRAMGGLMRVNPDSLTSEEAEKMVMLQMENARKILTIREKYYKEFRTVLTPQQIIRLFQIEADIRRKVMQEFRRRFGERQ